MSRDAQIIGCADMPQCADMPLLPLHGPKVQLGAKFGALAQRVTIPLKIGLKRLH